MQKAICWAWRDPIEKKAITLVWLIPLLAIITCDPPDIRVVFAAIVTVVLLEALFARWTGRKVSWRRLFLAAFVGALVSQVAIFVGFSSAAHSGPMSM